MQSQGNFSGVIAPILTPFADDYTPDSDRYIEHAEWLLDNGCAALAPFGTTSEANSLGLDERMELLEELVGAGIDPEVLLPGTGMCAMTDAAILTQHAMDIGCGGVLMLPPFYYKSPSDDGVFDYYAHIIEDVADDRLQVYLYHYPQMSGVPLSLDLVDRLAKAFPETVAGIKDSSGDRENLLALLARFPDLEIFPGTEKLMLEGLRNGAAGVISATANLACSELSGLYERRDEDDAEFRQQTASELRTSLEAYPAIPVLKALLASYRREPGWAMVRPPLVTFELEKVRGIAEALRQRHGFSLSFANQDGTES